MSYGPSDEEIQKMMDDSPTYPGYARLKVRDNKDTKETKETKETKDEMDLYTRSVTLDTCRIQTEVLERLRTLVVQSIDQVKRCINMSPQYR